MQLYLNKIYLLSLAITMAKHFEKKYRISKDSLIKSYIVVIAKKKIMENDKKSYIRN